MAEFAALSARVDASVRRALLELRRLIAGVRADLDEHVADFTDWTDVTFENSWFNYGGIFQDVQYRKVGDEVQLRGLARKDATFTDQIIFTLPVGFRPPKQTLLSVLCFGNLGSGTGEYHDRININASGGVSTSWGSTATSGNWVSFHHNFSTVA